MRTETLSIVGLGKLGSCTAACFAYKGIRVIGYDISEDVVAAINDRKAPFVEPKLQELIDNCDDRYQATADPKRLMDEADITFVLVPTPSNPDGSFSNDFIKKALRPLLEHLKGSDKGNHLFVIISTVFPGAIRGEIIPFMEEISGRKFNDGFRVCYNPEFVAIGSIIRDFLGAGMILVGEGDDESGQILEDIYTKVCDRPYVARMSIESAEITKLFFNIFCTLKVSFANSIGNICERVPGSNADDISKALGSHKWISPYFIKPATAFGGPCWPRDLRAYSLFASQNGLEAQLVDAVQSMNELQIKMLHDKIVTAADKYSEDGRINTVSVIGLSYKANTPVIEESPSLRLIEMLMKEGFKVSVHDHLALDNVKKEKNFPVSYCSSLAECMNASNISVIMQPIDSIRKFDEDEITVDPLVIFDCWRAIPREKLKRATYVPVAEFMDGFYG